MLAKVYVVEPRVALSRRKVLTGVRVLGARWGQAVTNQSLMDSAVKVVVILCLNTTLLFKADHPEPLLSQK